ncbi:hypothetical protein XM38_000490 [Halomicronema hongdechloris C2206]|uniref:Uncharacterized protein n=1 Tax=Halomicronema hongdechloris C2206 TaxID=1641165 RepID=A0A1Z3HFR6_9CYAN|nr:hypothetical protein [Halomicronema hongdechloris]ASC69123.1 hypothetical protein XM38_000490 [Halomicronema hongdechloris C2206]
MNEKRMGNLSFPAPCLVDTGVVVNKADMMRLLRDLGQVHYRYSQDGQFIREGEGYVLDVFADGQQSTLVANRTLYLNVHSFDYLEMGDLNDSRAYFDLVQDNRCLRLIPLSNPLQDQTRENFNAATLEAMLTEALSASWDACLDDDGQYPD